MIQQVICEELTIEKNQIICHYTVLADDLMNSFFTKPWEFRAIYDEDISNVPQGIAVIPFICNVLPLIWIQNAELIVDEIDRTFYESIEKFKKGYIEMYPDIKFKGRVIPKHIVDYHYSSDNSAVLFSGGVDAFTTLISHIEECPALVTLWGADISFKNKKGWQVVENQVKETAKKFSLDYHIVRTNFREILCDLKLKEYLNTINSNYGWWHEFQHGIGIISHTAPLAFLHGFGKVYIASSYTAADIGNYTCASDPTIDNYLRFGSTQVIHDGYELNRPMKITRICNFVEKSNIQLPLRVCWISKDGKNCCNCEKCYRTIMGILAEKKNPRDFGFDLYDKDVRKKMLHDLRWQYIAKYNFFYRDIQNAMKKNYTHKTCPADLKWFYNLKFSEKKSVLVKAYLKLRSILKRLLKLR